MKNIFRAFAVLFAFSIASCNFIDPELNVDPNNPLDVSMDLLLPQAQVTYAYVQGGDFGRYVSCWTQHHAGVERQHSAIEVYEIKEGDVNNAWNGVYAGALMDLSIILEKSREEEAPSPHFEGVAQIMTALIMANVVDLWNDVPFSDALRGAEQLRPSYDDAASVYQEVDRMLREAVVNLQEPISVFSPAGSDLVYGGDRVKWVELAQTLRARYALRLSKIDNGAYGKARDFISEGISSNLNNAMVVFGSSQTEGNPWYQFESQRGDVVMGAFFIDLMNSIDDPRRTAFATLNDADAYAGATAGVPDNSPAVSRFGTYYASINSPIPLATYAERKFIEAEVMLPVDADAAAEAHNEAIAASLAQTGVSDDDFLAAEASETGATITLEKILTHKYIALHSTMEPFADWRRTGIPDLQPAAGTTQIARRYPYAQAERLLNAANYIDGVTQYDRVFWDAN